MWEVAVSALDSHLSQVFSSSDVQVLVQALASFKAQDSVGRFTIGEPLLLTPPWAVAAAMLHGNAWRCEACWHVRQGGALHHFPPWPV